MTTTKKPERRAFPSYRLIGARTFECCSDEQRHAIKRYLEAEGDHPKPDAPEEGYWTFWYHVASETTHASWTQSIVGV